MSVRGVRMEHVLVARQIGEIKAAVESDQSFDWLIVHENRGGSILYGPATELQHTAYSVQCMEPEAHDRSTQARDAHGLVGRVDLEFQRYARLVNPDLVDLVRQQIGYQ